MIPLLWAWLHGESSAKIQSLYMFLLVVYFQDGNLFQTNLHPPAAVTNRQALRTLAEVEPSHPPSISGV